ncbi:MAG: Nudix family hydrolase [Gammaproteobacteria bacterium]
MNVGTRDPMLHVAVAVVSDQQGRVLICQRPQHKHLGGLWEFPGGKVKPEEEVLAALRRELREETGIEGEPSRPFIQIQHRYPDRDVFLDVWRVDRWRGNAQPLEGQRLQWASPGELDPQQFPAADLPIIKALRLPSLYLISPEPRLRAPFLAKLAQCLEAGVRLLQLRAKHLAPGDLCQLAAQSVEICASYGARLLLNADPVHAISLGAAGVHLTAARLLQLRQRPLDHRFLVAASCHNAVEIEHACNIGVDFVVLGPVRPTPTHAKAKILGWEGFQDLVRASQVPVFALGGLEPKHMAQAWRCGAQGIAAIRSVWQAPDPAAAVRACLESGG